MPTEPLTFAHSDQIKFRATLEAWFRDKDISPSKGCSSGSQACAKNLLPLLVPCHRVVGINGLGGYAFGKIWKEILLMREKSTPS